MEYFCESGCGEMVKASGCKWCPDCYPKFSMGHSLQEMSFVVVAGKYEEMGGITEENIKFASDPMQLRDAEELLKSCSGYHFARIEYVESRERE